MTMVEWEDEHPTQKALRAVNESPPPLRLAPEFGNPPPPSSLAPETSPRLSAPPSTLSSPSMPEAEALGKRAPDSDRDRDESASEPATDKVAPRPKLSPPKLPSADEAAKKTGEEPTSVTRAKLLPPRAPSDEAPSEEKPPPVKTGEEPTSTNIVPPELPPSEERAVNTVAKHAPPKMGPPKLPPLEEMAVSKNLPPPEEMAVKKKLPPPEEMAVKLTDEEASRGPGRRDMLHVPAPPPVPFATPTPASSRPLSAGPPSSVPISLIESAPLPLVPIALSYDDDATVVRPKSRDELDDEGPAPILSEAESEARRRERAQTLAAALRDAARWRQRAIVLGWTTIVLAIALVVLGVASFGG